MIEKSNKLTGENNKPDMVDLLNLIDKENAELKAGIQQTRGTVQMWVHSHYRENDSSRRYGQYSYALEKYEKQRTTLITHRVKMRLPTIALIESDMHDPYREAISQHAAY